MYTLFWISLLYRYDKKIIGDKKNYINFFELKDLNKIMLYYFKSVDDREFMSWKKNTKSNFKISYDFTLRVLLKTEFSIIVRIKVLSLYFINKKIYLIL